MSKSSAKLDEEEAVDDDADEDGFPPAVDGLEGGSPPPPQPGPPPLPLPPEEPPKGCIVNNPSTKI